MVAVGYLFVDVISRIQNRECESDVEQQVLDFLDGKKPSGVLGQHLELLNQFITTAENYHKQRSNRGELNQIHFTVQKPLKSQFIPEQLQSDIPQVLSLLGSSVDEESINKSDAGSLKSLVEVTPA